MKGKLINLISNEKTLEKAWSNIQHRRDSKGYDDQTILDFGENLSKNLSDIKRKIRSNTYNFEKLKGTTKKKENGGYRPLRIPAVKDRVTQKAIAITIYDYLNKVYGLENKVSFAYIKGQSVKKAASQVRLFYLAGNNHVYVADIEKFFDTVNKKILMKMIEDALPDNSINKLIGEALKNEVGNLEELKKCGFGDLFQKSFNGIPQGGILSPLFANVYLSLLDKEMIENNFNMVRYADDFVVLCKSKKEAIKAEDVARQIIEDKLCLKLHKIDENNPESKSKIIKMPGLEFLGLKFEGSGILPGTNAIKKMITYLESLPNGTNQNRPQTLFDFIDELRDKTFFWGETYHYTKIESNIYNQLDSTLLEATKRILKKFGLQPIVKTNNINYFKNLGIYPFKSSADRSKTLHLKKEKDEQIKYHSTDA